MAKTTSQVNLLKKYIKRWQTILGLTHYTFEFQFMVENEQGNIADIIAAMSVIEAQNTVYCRIYPIAEHLTVEDLWRVAAHEVLHVSMDKYVGFVRRRFGDLDHDLGSEEEIRLETVVDYLSKQLVKMLPLSLVYGKIETLDKGGDVSVPVVAIVDSFNLGGNVA